MHDYLMLTLMGATAPRPRTNRPRDRALSISTTSDSSSQYRLHQVRCFQGHNVRLQCLAILPCNYCQHLANKRSRPKLVMMQKWLSGRTCRSEERLDNTAQPFRH